MFLQKIHRMSYQKFLVCVSFLLPFLFSCRGQESAEPPIHWQRGMFTQDKCKPQRESNLFFDHRCSRPKIDGTVAINEAFQNAPFYSGMKEGTNKELEVSKSLRKDPRFISEFPVTVTMQLLKNGQQNFNRFCAPCHDLTGGGNGIVIERSQSLAQAGMGKSFSQPASYLSNELQEASNGYLFNVITNGIGPKTSTTMPSYGKIIPIEDRWAIVGYIRALQRAGNADITDIPSAKQGGLQ